MTVVILVGCVAAFGILIGLVMFTDRPDDPEGLAASRRRHPSSRQPTHVRGPVARPYDYEKDGG
jgi:hypothetical protein